MFDSHHAEDISLKCYLFRKAISKHKITWLGHLAIVHINSDPLGINNQTLGSTLDSLDNVPFGCFQSTKAEVVVVQLFLVEVLCLLRHNKKYSGDR
jgi:hypothetical protein